MSSATIGLSVTIRFLCRPRQLSRDRGISQSFRVRKTFTVALTSVRDGQVSNPIADTTQRAVGAYVVCAPAADLREVTTLLSLHEIG